MTITFKPIKPEEFRPSRRSPSNSYAADVINGFINSGEPLALVELDGDSKRWEQTPGQRKKGIHSSLIGYCRRHSKPVTVVTGMEGQLYLKRTDVEVESW